MKTDELPLNAQISHKAFFLSQKDIDVLRSRVAALPMDMPRQLIMRMKKAELVTYLLREDFGFEAVTKYKKQCEEWDDSEIEGRALAKQLETEEQKDEVVF